jgi:hypothetical protein
MLPLIQETGRKFQYFCVRRSLKMRNKRKKKIVSEFGEGIRGGGRKRRRRQRKR